MRFSSEGQIYTNIGGLLFNLNLSVTGSTAGTYGVSIGSLEDGSFLGNSNEKFTTTYAVGLEDDEWDPSTWDCSNVLNNENANEEEIFDAIVKLTWEIAKTEWAKGDANELEALVALLEDIDLNQYQDENEKDAFSATLKSAQELIAEKDNFFQNKINAAYKALDDAYKASKGLGLDGI